MINVKVLMDGTIKALGKLEKQTKVATMIALTKTAAHAQRLMYDEFKAKIDRPTRATMKSLYVEPAKRDKLWSRVYMKDKAMGGKNPRSMAEILGHHFEGGGRVRKSLEDVLTQWNFIGAGEFVAPGPAAKLDRYGNMSRGQIVQILSQLQIIRSGVNSTPTNSARSKRNVARTGVIFWSWGPAASRKPKVDKETGITYGYTGGSRSHLAKGAWVRTGSGVRPLLLVVGKPTYRRRFDFKKVGEAAVDRHFDAEFSAALKYVKATER